MQKKRTRAIPLNVAHRKLDTGFVPEIHYKNNSNRLSEDKQKSKNTGM